MKKLVPFLAVAALVLALLAPQSAQATRAIYSQVIAILDELGITSSGAYVAPLTTAGDGLTNTGTTVNFVPGDGLDTAADSASLDLATGGGLKIVSTEAAVEPADFAGTGIEDDGSDNLRIAAAAAGAGLTGGAGSALAVGAGTGIAVAADAVSVDATWEQILTNGATATTAPIVGVTGGIKFTLPSSQQAQLVAHADTPYDGITVADPQNGGRLAALSWGMRVNSADTDGVETWANSGGNDLGGVQLIASTVWVTSSAYTLPACVTGFRVRARITNNLGARIFANASDAIVYNGVTSADGGYLAGYSAGSEVELYGNAAANWEAVATGFWTIDEVYPPSANIVYYYDARIPSITTTTGLGVSAWRDFSGNNWEVVQTTDADRPLFVSDAGGTGLHAVRFDAANSEYLSRTLGAGEPTAVPVAIFAVFKWISDTGASDYCAGFFEGGGGDYVAIRLAGSTNGNPFNFNASATAVTLTHEGPSYGRTALLANYYTTISRTGWVGFPPLTFSATNNTSVAQLAFTLFALGAELNGAAGGFADMDQFAVVVYSTPPDDVTRTKLYLWAADIWGGAQ